MYRNISRNVLFILHEMLHTTT